MGNRSTARVHLLVAKEAPVVVIISGWSLAMGVGGYWSDHKTLHLNEWTSVRGSAPFTTVPQSAGMGEDFTVLYPRMRRDGWKRATADILTLALHSHSRCVIIRSLFQPTPIRRQGMHWAS